ncbi:MAG: HNH endonuclease, partial [Peptostreptococcaceae bacterium]
MRSGIKKHILFNPITAERKLYTYEELTAITGRTAGHLKNYKKKARKLKCLNAYILDEDVHIRELKSLMKKEKLNNEIWKNYNEKYSVSNYGRARNNKTGKLLMPFYNANHVFVRFGENVSLPRTVYTLFVGDIPKGKIVYNKSNNAWECNVDNLRLGTKADVVKKNSFIHAKQVVAVSFIGGKEIYFNSLREARRQGFDVGLVSKAISEKYIYRGFAWFYYDDYTGEEDLSLYFERNNNKKPIKATELDTGDVTYYDSITSLAEEINYSSKY